MSPELIKNHAVKAPNKLVIVIPIEGRSLSTIAPNFGAKRVAKTPASKYAQITKLMLLSIFSIK